MFSFSAGERRLSFFSLELFGEILFEAIRYKIFIWKISFGKMFLRTLATFSSVVSSTRQIAGWAARISASFVDYLTYLPCNGRFICFRLNARVSFRQRPELTSARLLWCPQTLDILAHVYKALSLHSMHI